MIEFFLCMSVGSLWNWWGKKPPPKIKREKHWRLGWGRRRGGFLWPNFLCMYVGSLWNWWGKKTHQKLKEKNIAGWDGWGGGGRVLVTEFFCACMLVRCGIVGKCISVGKLDDNLF